MADIFISYASDDRPAAQRLAGALEREGWSVWWDRVIPPGRTFAEAIEEQLTAAGCVVVLWSETAVASRWVQREARFADRRGKLIPALIAEVEPPFEFSDIHAAPLTGWEDREPHLGYSQLVEAVAGLAGPPPREQRDREETARREAEAEAKRTAEEEEESRRRAEEEAKRKAEEEERKRAEERRRAEAEAARKKAEEEAARTETVAEAKPKAEAKAEREAERTPARPRRAAGRRIALAAVVVMAIAGIGAAVLWQSSPSEEESLARQEQLAAEEEAKRKAEEQEARRQEEAEAQRRAEEAAARRADEEAQKRAEEQAKQRAAEEEARRQAEEEDARRSQIEATTAELFVLTKLNVRAGPGIEHERLTTLARGSPVTVTGLAGDWYRVALADDRSGFVFRELLGETSPAGLQPAGEVGREPGETFRDCDVCPEMVVVPAGSFMMGSPPNEEGRDEDEGPQHRVTIAEPFAVGINEVTFAEWDACVDGGGCGGYRPVDQGWGRGQQPVIYVSWSDAQAYVKWLRDKTGNDYRLLSEAEWEYAARAGTTTPFHFGQTISPDEANYNGDYTYDGGPKGVNRRKTVPVGSFPANAFGVHDMHGNVWEWVEDCWHGNYDGAPSDGGAWTTGGDCSRRVLRGGSWGSFPWFLRSAIRGRDDPVGRDVVLGFRVARTF